MYNANDRRDALSTTGNLRHNQFAPIKMQIICEHAVAKLGRIAPWLKGEQQDR
jgi:hypothetical protein